MRDHGAPQALPRGIQTGQALTFSLGDAQGDAVIHRAVTVGIQLSDAASDIDDLYHDPAVLGYPHALLNVIGTQWYRRADREI